MSPKKPNSKTRELSVVSKGAQAGNRKDVLMSRRTVIQTATGAGAALALSGMLAAMPAKAAVSPAVTRGLPGARDGAYFLGLWQQHEELGTKLVAATTAWNLAENAAEEEFPPRPISEGVKLRVESFPGGALQILDDFDHEWETQRAAYRKKLADYHWICRAISRDHGVARLKAKVEAAAEYFMAMENRIVDTPAADLIGVCLKLRLVEASGEMGFASTPDDDLCFEHMAFRRALGDLDCMVGPAFLDGTQSPMGVLQS